MKILYRYIATYVLLLFIPYFFIVSVFLGLTLPLRALGDGDEPLHSTKPRQSTTQSISKQLADHCFAPSAKCREKMLLRISSSLQELNMDTHTQKKLLKMVISLEEKRKKGLRTKELLHLLSFPPNQWKAYHAATLVLNGLPKICFKSKTGNKIDFEKIKTVTNTLLMTEDWDVPTRKRFIQIVRRLVCDFEISENPTQMIQLALSYPQDQWELRLRAMKLVSEIALPFPDLKITPNLYHPTLEEAQDYIEPVFNGFQKLSTMGHEFVDQDFVSLFRSLRSFFLNHGMSISPMELIETAFSYPPKTWSMRATVFYLKRQKPKHACRLFFEIKKWSEWSEVEEAFDRTVFYLTDCKVLKPDQVGAILSYPPTEWEALQQGATIVSMLPEICNCFPGELGSDRLRRIIQILEPTREWEWGHGPRGKMFRFCRLVEWLCNLERYFNRDGRCASRCNPDIWDPAQVVPMVICTPEEHWRFLNMATTFVRSRFLPSCFKPTSAPSSEKQELVSQIFNSLVKDGGTKFVQIYNELRKFPEFLDQRTILDSLTACEPSQWDNVLETVQILQKFYEEGLEASPERKLSSQDVESLSSLPVAVKAWSTDIRAHIWEHFVSNVVAFSQASQGDIIEAMKTLLPYQPEEWPRVRNEVKT